MKKTLISATVASVIALASSSAMAAGPDIYGRIDVAATHTQTKGSLQTSTSGVQDGGTYFENNFSHIGFKGTEKLNENMDVLYQMEFGVDNMGANKASSPFNARNTFLGLRTNFGTALVGRNDPVFKQTEGSVDVFGNTSADMDRLVAGQGRVGDGLWYYSPKIADLVTLNATYLMKSNQVVARGRTQYALSATLGDAKLKMHNFYVATGLNKAINNVDAYRFVGQMKLADFTLGGLYQHSKSATLNNLKGSSYIASIKYNLNGVNLKAQYGYDGAGLGNYAKNLGLQNKDNSDFNINQMDFGADYKLAKSTMIYGQYSFYQGHYKEVNTKVDLKDDNVFSFGVRYDF